MKKVLKFKRNFGSFDSTKAGFEISLCRDDTRPIFDLCEAITKFTLIITDKRPKKWPRGGSWIKVNLVNDENEEVWLDLIGVLQWKELSCVAGDYLKHILPALEKRKSRIKVWLKTKKEEL